ncbi:hypothetical protein SDJN02_26361, partial [Cucurbita argyrosperma subsp. argyrosperma]
MKKILWLRCGALGKYWNSLLSNIEVLEKEFLEQSKIVFSRAGNVATFNNPYQEIASAFNNSSE